MCAAAQFPAGQSSFPTIGAASGNHPNPIRNNERNTMTCPLEIAIAVHYWTTPGEYDGGESDHYNSRIVQEYLREFVGRGLLTTSTNIDGKITYKSTDALGVWVAALCQVPFPIQKWVIPDKFTNLDN